MSGQWLRAKSGEWVRVLCVVAGGVMVMDWSGEPDDEVTVYYERRNGQALQTKASWIAASVKR